MAKEVVATPVSNSSLVRLSLMFEDCSNTWWFNHCVSNRRMAEWPPHPTETFDSIWRGKAVMAAPHMVCENCSHLFYFELYVL